MNTLAPEHLALHGARAEALAAEFSAFGALFVGAGAAEVFGDYGIGPNHVLPTGASARYSSGLSVLTFLTLRTYQQSAGSLDAKLIEETMELAAGEGLCGHWRAASLRLQRPA